MTPAGLPARPVSVLQQQLLVAANVRGDHAPYVLTLVVTVRGGRLDPTPLRAALALLAGRHESLRTVFRAGRGGWERLILDEVNVPLVVGGPGGAGPVSGADLLAGPPVRARLEPGGDVLVLTVHHAVFDGWSARVLVRDLARCYDHVLGRGGPPPSARPAADPDPGPSDGLVFWRAALAGAPTSTGLQPDRPGAQFGSRAGHLHRALDPAATDRLLEVGRPGRAGPHALALAALAIVLAARTGRRDLPIAVPTVGRSGAHADLIGLFVNTTVLRVDVTDDPALPVLAGRVSAATRALLPYAAVPFSDVLGALRPARPAGHDPYADVVVNEVVPAGPVASARGLTWDGRLALDGPVRAPLELFVRRSPNGIELTWAYSLSLFDRATVADLADAHRAVLLGPPNRPASRSVPSAARPAPPPLLTEIVAGQARTRPDAVAVRAGGTALTYRALDRRADQLAEALRERGAGPEQRVGVCLGRGVDMVVGLLGVLRSGAAVLPLDPTLPPRRITEMLDLAGAELVVTTGDWAGLVPSRPLLRLDDPARADWPAIGQRVALHPNQLAYVLFTSGSTGQPKPVAIDHGTLAAMAAAQAALGLPVDPRVLVFASIGFDGSLWELFLALGAGGTACLDDRAGGFDPAALATRLDQDAVDVAVLPSAVLGVLAPSGPLPGLLCVAGDVCPPGVVQRWAPGRRLLNVYGTTEAAAVSVVGELTPGAEVSLGHPLPSARVDVVAGGRAAPVGTVGELVLAGPLARGYLDAPATTAAAFVPDPLGLPGARSYRTGDRGRHDNTGRLWFHGRTDDQVKIRGQRVELGEVEAVLARHTQVERAAVVVVGTSAAERSLVAYALPTAGAWPSTDLLRDYLAALLPAAAVPAQVYLLDTLPLNANGKVDRAALRSAEASSAPAATEDPVATVVAAVWSDVLHQPDVRAEDNFFAIGGHSLAATIAQARVQDLFDVDLSVTLLFELLTPAGIAGRIVATIGPERAERTAALVLDALRGGT